MNDLDKYFEKARNVEPDISQDDTRKILAGKLSDGGIITNLYHKIRTYPMITTLITSAAIVGILMLSQFAEPTNDSTVKQNNKTEITDNSDGIVPEQEDKPEVYDYKKEKEFNKENPPVPSDSNFSKKAGLNYADNIIPEEEDGPESYDYKKEKDFLKKNPPKPTDVTLLKRKPSTKLNSDSRENNWTNDEVNIKSINSLKLANDELEALGIVANRDNFKINAFNKYAFTIYANNEKDREYFDEDRDKDAYPTPAMVTTSTGFKTLTLFKNDGIEAIVDRFESEDGDSKTLQITASSTSNVDLDIDENLPEFKFGEMSFDEYKSMLSGHKDSSKVISQFENLEDFQLKVGNKEMTFNLKDLLKSGEMSSETIDKFIKVKELEGEVEDDISLKVEVDANSKDGTRNEFRYIKKKIDRKVNLKSEDLSEEDIEKIMITSLDSLDGDVIELVESDDDVQVNNNGRTIHMPIKSLGEGKKIKIKSTSLNSDVNVRDLLQRSSDKVMLKKIISNEDEAQVIDGTVVDESDINTITTLNIDTDKKVGMLINKPGQTVWTDDSESDSNTTRLYSNMSFSLIKHDINKLIPIEVSLDGGKTDFIVWYEATDDFLEKLPSRLIQKINPELNAADDQAEHCDNEPVKKDDAVMDVWSGCSGAIKGMKLYPNPAVDQSSVELSLEENRNLSIAIYNLSGQLIKRIGTPTQYSKGQLNKPLDLSGINPGLYYVVVKSELGEQALQRIIIE